MRKDILLNSKWRFHKGDINVPYPTDKGPVYSQCKTARKLIGPAAYNYYSAPDGYGDGSYEMRSEGWKWVNLPHDYIIDQMPDEQKGNNATGYFEYDNAWYRKGFELGEEYKGKRITLFFEGIAGKATIYINGCLIKHNYSSYNSFEVDITDYVFIDRWNILAVYVEGTDFEGWWYQGAGIYRDVHLISTEQVSIDLYGVYAPARELSGGKWAVDFETTVRNDRYDNSEVTVKSRILDRDGKEVGFAECDGSVTLREKATFKYTAEVDNPELWNVDSPYLYTVETSLYVGGELYDVNSTRIGFRTVKITADDGMYINGKKTVIKGVCCHQDFGLTGIAVPNNIAKYKIKLIKEMGANGYRTSHYQQSAATMDALDELGFIVMDEVRWFESSDEGMEQLDSLILRDRNRPSVIFWSTSNEEHHHVTDIGRRIHKAMAAHIRKLDNTRFITAAQSVFPEKSTVFDDCDVIGINYNLESYDAVHKLYPDKAVFASECCATGTTRDWHIPSSSESRITDKDRDTNSWFKGRENTWKFLMERSYVLGGYQWAAVEHRGEAAWPCLCSKSGAIDLFLQKKGAFYQNKSHWTDEPMVHIVPHWNFKGLEGEPINVTVYTNCDALELFLNGSSLGKKQIEKYGHGEWSVPYEPGELKAVGYRGGNTVSEHTVCTTKTPAKLSLRLENEISEAGRDMALFTCECLDEDGKQVPNAAEFVRFSTTENAKIIGTGSDNCDSRKVTLSDRKMYAGKISVAVLPSEGTEEFSLYAYSESLGMTYLTVKLKK